MGFIITVGILLHAASAVGDGKPRANGVAPIAIVKLKRTTPVDFEKDVRPILVKKCFVCHSASVTEGKLDVSSVASMKKGGRRGPSIVPGKSANSLLVKLAGRSAKPVMPPKDETPLTPAELALLKLWVNQGAKPSPGTAKPAVVKFQPLSPTVQIVRALAFSPDGKSLAVGRANRVAIYDVASGKFVRVLASSNSQKNRQAHVSLVESLAYSPDGKWLVSGSFGEVAVWNARTGVLRQRLTGFADRVVALAFSPDGKYLAVGGGAATVSGEVKLFEAANGKLVTNITRNIHSDTVFGLCFSPDGKKLAAGGADHSIRLFDVPTGKHLKTMEGHTHHVLDVGWRADGKLIASAGADKKVRLWDVKTGEQHTKINRGGGRITTILLDHDNQVSRLAFVGKSSQIVTISGDSPAKLWSVEMSKRRGNYTANHLQGRNRRSFGDGKDYLESVTVSRDGSLIATGGESGVVRLYELKTGKTLHSLMPAR